MRTALANDLKTLTAFRFFAAFWVFLFHLRLRIDHDQGWYGNIVENGARGVDFFFILSGFVIFHVYERQIIQGRFSRRNYMIKRFARIYPLHLTMLLIFLLLALVGINPVHGFFVSVFLVHAWGLTENLTLNGPSWTLSAEMFAYFLFGVFAVRKLPTWTIALAFVVTSVCVHLFALKLGHAGFLHLTWDFGSLRILPLFILGMLLRRLTPLISVTLVAAMAAFGVVMLLFVTGAGPVEYEILIPFSLLIVGGARLSDVQGLPTNSRPLVYLGEISYSIYLTHILVITVFVDYLPKLGLETPSWPVIGLALILGSSASYQLIEVPARRWLNQYAKSKPATEIP